ncbi:hypothetical protein [Desulfobacula sp.]
MKKFDKLYINGEWIKSNSDEIIEVINPATEKSCAQVPGGNQEDVNAAAGFYHGRNFCSNRFAGRCV